MALIRRLPIRLRLTLSFAVVMAAVLAATGAFVYLRLESDLDHGIDQALRARAAELAHSVGSGAAVQPSPQVDEADETFAQVLASDGRVVSSPAQLRSRPLLTPAQLRRARLGTVRVERAERPGLEEPARLLATPADGEGGSRVLVVGATLDDRDEALSGLAAVLLVGGPVALVLASLAGYALAAAALRPVESMRRTAAEVSLTTPGTRLPVPPARDEIARLGETLNQMLGRQEAAFERERTFVGDASHELRTPLAILRTELELALRGGRSAAELETAVRSAAEQTDRLNQLAEDLLLIARFEQDRLPVRLEVVPASGLLDRMRDRFAGRAAAADRQITVDGPPDLQLVADPLRLEQALGNLLENALRYGAGDMEIEVERREAKIRVHVRDRGPGFPPAFLPDAFQRFSRGDAGRTGGGAGLGLAIVAAIAHAHGGECGAGNRDGGGADVWLSVPVGSSSSHRRSVDTAVQADDRR